MALVVAPGSAGATGTDVPHATDPSATADALLFQRLGGPAVISRGGPEIALPGKHPAIGGRYVATVTGDAIQLLDRNSLAPVAQIAAPGADAIAVSDSWLAYRAPTGGGDGIYIRYIANPASPAPPALLATSGGASQLSPPGGRREHPRLRDRDAARQPRRPVGDGNPQAPRAGPLAGGCCSSTPRSTAARSPTSARTRAAAG